MSNRIIVAGASGLIGSTLVAALRERGDEVVCLVRREPRGPHEVRWDPTAGDLRAGALDGAHAVVVLNGASVGHLPWTAAYRSELVTSRLAPVRTVTRALAELDGPLLVSASAVGFYGSQPDVELTESSRVGRTFLARLCQQWEGQALAAAPHADVALLRTAPVVHRESFLRPLIALTRLGLAGPLAGGGQVWPWISLADEVRAIMHVIDRRLTGPVNLCGPTPATANDVGRAVARALRRPFWLPTPAFGLRLLLGRDAADCLLLADADTRPRALLDSGFVFKHSTVELALAAALS